MNGIKEYVFCIIGSRVQDFCLNIGPACEASTQGASLFREFGTSEVWMPADDQQAKVRMHMNDRNWPNAF